MPQGMKLRSSMTATSIVEPSGPLSLRTYLNEIGAFQEWPVPLQRFVEYGMWLQQRAVPDVDERSVARLEREGTGFRLVLGDGESVTARRVVVAAGIERFASTPAGFGHLPAGRVSHTGEHSDLSVFAGRRVAVVGGGQSAFECATMLREQGAADVELMARSRDVVWLRSYSPKTLLGPLGVVVYAPTDVGPLWYSRLVATPPLFRRLPRATQTKIAYRSIRPACAYFVKVRLDDVKVSLGTEIRSAHEQDGALRLALADGGEREVDHIMFGTGYRVDIARYPFLDERLLAGIRRVDGYPVLRRGLECSVPGLYFVGAPAAWSFGPVMRFVSGSWYAGRAVARSLAASARPAMTA
jgi:cation diffusion facilitator CzcD-associated flavoprotein CzcO